MPYSVLNRIIADGSPVARRLSGLVLLGTALCTLPFIVGVCQAQSLVVSPSSLSFTQVVDLADPPAQTVQVTASDGTHIPFTVPWPFCTGGNARMCLTGSPTTAVTPATITVTASGAVAIGASLAFLEPWPLVISEDLPFVPTPPSPASAASLKGVMTLTEPPPPTVNSVVNAISQLPGVSSGELVTITGQYLASSDTARYQCVRAFACFFPMYLGNTYVSFNGSLATFMGYSSPGSITMIVPRGLTGPSVQIVLQHFSQSTAVTLPLVQANPAICPGGPPYTIDSTKWCCPPDSRDVCIPGAFLNQDYSLNGPGNPAPIGTCVVFLTNGLGAGPLSVTIGEQLAEVGCPLSIPLYRYESGSFLGQVSAIIPPGIAPGSQPVVLAVGDANNLPQQIMVEVENAQPPKITSVVNAASFDAPLSPGEIVSIFGQDLAHPAAAYTFVLTAAQQPTVTMNGFYTHLLFTDRGQINAIVPYELAGQSSASVVVTHYGQSTPFTVVLADTSPAIFTLDGSGSGQGAILNVDNTVNSAKQPAAAGSVIQVFATGAGLWNQPLTQILRVYLMPPFPVPLAPVSLTIGGQAAQIQYAAGAPGLFFGVLQVNAVVPAGLASGPQPLVLKIGENSNAQQQVTVAIQ
jgi:uncharacterized protein (TIGR03437 family)